MAQSPPTDLRCLSQNRSASQNGLAQTGRQLATADIVKNITKSTLPSSKFRHAKVGARSPIPSHVDSGATTNSPAKFYRLQLVRQRSDRRFTHHIDDSRVGSPKAVAPTRLDVLVLLVVRSNAAAITGFAASWFAQLDRVDAGASGPGRTIDRRKVSHASHRHSSVR